MITLSHFFEDYAKAYDDNFVFVPEKYNLMSNFMPFSYTL